MEAGDDGQLPPDQAASSPTPTTATLTCAVTDETVTAAGQPVPPLALPNPVALHHPAAAGSARDAARGRLVVGGDRSDRPVTATLGLPG